MLKNAVSDRPRTMIGDVLTNFAQTVIIQLQMVEALLQMGQLNVICHVLATQPSFVVGRTDSMSMVPTMLAHPTPLYRQLHPLLLRQLRPLLLRRLLLLLLVGRPLAATRIMSIHVPLHRVSQFREVGMR